MSGKMKLGHTRRILVEHGVKYRLCGDIIEACQEWYNSTTGEHSSEWVDVTGWTLPALLTWLGY